MRKIILGMLLSLAPALLFAQSDQEKYEIYSQYLHLNKAGGEGNANFVVRESTAYGRTVDPGISLQVKILRRWYNNGHSAVSGNAQYDSLRQKIKDDTTWIGLMAQLEEKMNQRFIVTNRFSPDLHVTLISDEAYYKIFGGNGSLTKAWHKFETKYQAPAYLIDLSAVVSDGKRALFYFARAWGGKAGYTSVIFFKKENGKWIYFGTDLIFMS